MIWNSKNGPVKVSEMEEEHVAHTINFLMRKYGGHLTLELLLKGRKVHLQEVESKRAIKKIKFHTPVEAALHAMTHLNGDIACMQVEGYLDSHIDPHNCDPYVDNRWEDEHES